MLELQFFIDHVCDFFAEKDYSFQVLERYLLKNLWTTYKVIIKHDNAISLIHIINILSRPDL